MNSIQLQVMDPDEQAAHHAVVLAANEAKESARIAASNRAAGYPEPKPGDRLYVSTARGIKRRARAGILFSETDRIEVRVVDDFAERPIGVVSTTVQGAERILADSGLNVTGRSATDAEAADLRSQLADRDSEIAKLKADNARIVREARMSAKDTGDGAPSRLMAARKAGRGLTDPDGGFGGKD